MIADSQDYHEGEVRLPMWAYGMLVVLAVILGVGVVAVPATWVAFAISKTVGWIVVGVLAVLYSGLVLYCGIGGSTE